MVIGTLIVGGGGLIVIGTLIIGGGLFVIGALIVCVGLIVKVGLIWRVFSYILSGEAALGIGGSTLNL